MDILDIDRLKELASKRQADWKRYFNKNKKNLLKKDVEIHQIHEEVVSKIDCLKCANCCRTLGPRVTMKDVERISKGLKMKPANFIEKYLRIDEDNDMVFNNMPCPFLDSENYCVIYENRPKACREYPHTDRKKFVQLYGITMKNAETCPIAFEVLERISAI